MTSIDYSSVTEAPGTRVTREALDMVWTRYAYAAQQSTGCDVLEVACGAGPGLGHLATRARSVVGGDYTFDLLQQARTAYAARIPLVRLDAHLLPFRDASFDVVLLYEAIYYLERPDRFLRECGRVLRLGGRVLICSVNPEWADFNPSPFSRRYWAAADLDRLLRDAGFEADVLGAFPVQAESPRDVLVSRMKRAAVAWHLVPATMRGKRLLKRLCLGRLLDFPADVREGMAEYRPPRPIDAGGAAAYKVLYAAGRLAAAGGAE